MSIAIVPAAPGAGADVCRISVSGADWARDPDKTGGEFRYYLEAERPAGSTNPKNLKSHEFDVSHDGEHVWLGVIFDEAGTWNIVLRDADGDGQVEAQSLAVS